MPDEKFDEKEMEKKDEKAPDEKWRRDPISSVVWAIILIWAGLVFLAGNLGLIDAIRRGASALPGGAFLARLQDWGLIFIGAGVILLVEVLIRLLLPEYRQSAAGNIVLAVIFIGIGLGDLFGWNVIWPLILIALGLSILLRGFLVRRH